MRNKNRACAEVGIKSEVYRMKDDVHTLDVLEKIEEYNNRPDIHGLIVQLPLPKQVNKNAVIEAILPGKDVDGFNSVNIGKLLSRQECLVPATSAGILELIRSTGVDIESKKATMVGHSDIVGKPTAVLLLNEWATVTVCHTRTKDLKYNTRDADIIIVATGVPYLITEDMVKEGAMVIDVGMNRIPHKDANSELLKWRKEDFSKKGYTLIGDVDFLNVSKKASYITPVPGGVGPMTIAMLLSNTLKAAKWSVGGSLRK